MAVFGGLLPASLITPAQYPYLLFPFVIGAALRFGRRAAVELALLVGVWPVSARDAARAGKALIHYGASAGHIPARMAVMKDTGGLLPRDAAMNRKATAEEQSAIAA